MLDERRPNLSAGLAAGGRCLVTRWSASYRRSMVVRSSVEVERTFELPAGAVLPDLVGTAGIAEVQRLPDESLDATYYDTHDFRLAASRVTLRRRQGGRDAGWHLKLPLEDKGREEVTLPLGRGATVPADLRALVRSRVRKAPLKPVARVRSRRRVLVLFDDAGRVLAEVAEDAVVGEVLGAAGSVAEWREVEVELVTGDAAFLDAVGAALVERGAWVSSQQSKLGRTLGARVPSRAVKAPARKGTAAEAVLAHLIDQVDELVLRDPSARRDVPDAVHKMRVATRRLRSALKTYRPLFDRSITDPLRGELKHLAAVLGAARDAEVLRDRLLTSVEQLPSDDVVGPVRERIRIDLDAQHAAALADLVVALNAPRHLALLEGLATLVAGPPWSDRSRSRASRELPAQVRRAVRALDRAVRAAEEAPDGQERDTLLHEVRKAAKQARYAAESTVPVVGKPAKAFAKAATRVQEVLGEHQDGVLAGERLRVLGVAAERNGESAFTFGVLHALERQRAESARASYAEARRALAARRLRRWLRESRP
jgi:CHAD domain-containing protein